MRKMRKVPFKRYDDIDLRGLGFYCKRPYCTNKPIYLQVRDQKTFPLMGDQSNTNFNVTALCEKHYEELRYDGRSRRYLALPDPEARAPLDAECEKCGRRYCDHEEKY